MALQTESAIVRPSTGLSANNGKQPADGFLNVSAVDKSGVEHRLQGGVPLYLDKKMHAAIISKLQAGEEVVFKVSLNMVEHDRDFDF